MQRLLFDFLFFSLGGTVGVIAMCILRIRSVSFRLLLLLLFCHQHLYVQLLQLQ